MLVGMLRGINAKAIGYLNALREKRINPYTALSLGDFTSNDALVQFCWDERRRELCFEECHRWWDVNDKDKNKSYSSLGLCGNKW